VQDIVRTTPRRSAGLRRDRGGGGGAGGVERIVESIVDQVWSFERLIQFDVVM